MRRKVLQDFANTVSQRLLDLPEGFDLATFAHYGSGLYRANLVGGACTCNDRPIPSLHLCEVYRAWLTQQCVAHRVEFASLKSIEVEIAVEVSGATIRDSYGHRFASARFDVKCSCRITTDEKAYVGNSSGQREWGFDWYYEKLRHAS